jgi:hypothetical protein
MVEILQILMGIFLLAAGCRLFWLFVGSLGFIAGMQLGMAYFALQPEWAVWGLALLLGIVGALLAVFFQTLAIGVGGFVAGSAITAYLLNFIGFTAPPIFSLIGGIISLILFYMAFDWALVGLSAVAGASLILHNINLNQQLQFVLFAALVVIGVFVQVNFLYHRPPATR